MADVPAGLSMSLDALIQIEKKKEVQEGRHDGHQRGGRNSIRGGVAKHTGRGRQEQQTGGHTSPGQKQRYHGGRGGHFQQRQNGPPYNPQRNGGRGGYFQQRQDDQILIQDYNAAASGHFEQRQNGQYFQRGDMQDGQYFQIEDMQNDGGFEIENEAQQGFGGRMQYNTSQGGVASGRVIHSREMSSQFSGLTDGRGGQWNDQGRHSWREDASEPTFAHSRQPFSGQHGDGSEMRGTMAFNANLNAQNGSSSPLWNRMSGDNPPRHSDMGMDRNPRGGYSRLTAAQSHQQKIPEVKPLIPKCHVQEDTGNIIVRLGDLDLMIISPEGAITLNTSGIRTPAVLQGLNDSLSVLNIRVIANQDASGGEVWTVSDGRSLVRFQDGLVLPAKGAATAHRNRAVLNAVSAMAESSPSAAAAATAASTKAAIAAGIWAPKADYHRGNNVPNSVGSADNLSHGLPSRLSDGMQSRNFPNRMPYQNSNAGSSLGTNWEESRGLNGSMSQVGLGMTEPGLHNASMGRNGQISDAERRLVAKGRYLA